MYLLTYAFFPLFFLVVLHFVLFIDSFCSFFQLPAILSLPLSFSKYFIVSLIISLLSFSVFDRISFVIFCYHYSWFCGVTSVMSTIFSAHLAMFLFPFLTLLALSLLEVWIFSLKSWFAVFQFLLFLLNNYPCFVAVCQGWQIACLK